MKKIVLASALVLFAFSSTLALTPEQICNTILPSQVNVEMISNDKSLGGGSGICIYAATEVSHLGPRALTIRYLYLFSTAAHVIDESLNSPRSFALRVFAYDERGKRTGERLIKNDGCDVFMEFLFNRETDAALLVVHSKTMIPEVRPVELLREIDLEKLMVGQRVMLLGSPMLVAPILCEGMIAQLNIRHTYDGDFTPWEIDLLSINAAPGDSGGGIFNEEGKLIGFLSLGFSQDFHGFVIGMINMREWYNLVRETHWSLLFEELFDPVKEVNEGVELPPSNTNEIPEIASDEDIMKPYEP